jgi:hypothetical protein
MTATRAMVLAVLLALSCAANAQDFRVHGYLDLRAVAAPDERSWTDGGLGKSRFGESDDGVRPGGALLALGWQIAPAWSASADLQYQADQRRHFDATEAYVRYRPVSVTPWRWSLKLGAFFPPISLENDAIGWVSPWTLTPSAIDSWVGEELRTIGAEFSLEHRGLWNTFQAGFALFGKNDPAGELLSSRGWSLSDLTSGLHAFVREPDVYATVVHASGRVDYRPFDEIDHRPGWYADVSWDSRAWGRWVLLRYDNRADPAAFENHGDRRVYAWHTRFWSASLRRQFGDVVVIAQAMDGITTIAPAPAFSLDTRFDAGYLLLGWSRGPWRPSLRADFFSLDQPTGASSPSPDSEHGRALTAALNWRPNDRLRVTGEWLRIDSTRNQRLSENLRPRRIDNQFQISARLLF